jgi:hypothetical protein
MTGSVGELMGVADVVEMRMAQHRKQRPVPQPRELRHQADDAQSRIE